VEEAASGRFSLLNSAELSRGVAGDKVPHRQRWSRLGGDGRWGRVEARCDVLCDNANSVSRVGEVRVGCKPGGT
jgi:hypothetical protein